MKVCQEIDCKTKVHCKNLCQKHYRRLKKHGTTYLKKLRITHGMTGTREYSTWSDMKARCLNKNNKDYIDYGARRITVCSRWLNFKNFYTNMGNKPLGMTLERVDNNKGYSKDNCIWADRKVQNNNLRKRKNCTSKYMFVYYRKNRNKWVARLKEKSGFVYLGSFDNEDDAQNAIIAYRASC